MKPETPDARTRLLQAALELFQEKGFSGTSTREICARAGVNVSMISYYFGSKTQLLESLVQERAENMLASLEGMSGLGASGREKLRHYISAYFDRVAQNTSLQKVFLQEMLTNRDGAVAEIIRRASERNIEAVSAILRGGIASGEFRPVEVELTVRSVLSLASYYTFLADLKGQPYLPADDAGLQRVKEHILEIFDRFLAV